MEKPITLTPSNIYIDAARSYVFSEIEKIESILNQDFQPFIQDKCRKIKSFLIEGIEKILDKGDLIDFKQQLKYISPLTDLFLTSSDSKSAWWAMALIKECYEKCDIDHTNRNILIVHYLNSNDYSVSADLLKITPIEALKEDKDPIDAFIIPSEAKHDIASIALIGHEVGHIYWKQNFNLIDKIIKEAFQDEIEITSMPLYGEEILKLKGERIANHIEEFLCDKIGRFLLGPAFDFALLKYFISYRNNQIGSLTHPSEDIRKDESINSLKNYKFSSSEIKECISNLITYLPNVEPPLPFNKDVDEFARKLAEKIHSDSSFQNGQDEKSFTEKWTKIKHELDAFRPPFEKVSREVPEAISPIDAVIVTRSYLINKI